MTQSVSVRIKQLYAQTLACVKIRNPDGRMLVRHHPSLPIVFAVLPQYHVLLPEAWSPVNRCQLPRRISSRNEQLERCRSSIPRQAGSCRRHGWFVEETPAQPWVLLNDGLVLDEPKVAVTAQWDIFTWLTIRLSNPGQNDVHGDKNRTSWVDDDCLLSDPLAQSVWTWTMQTRSKSCKTNQDRFSVPSYRSVHTQELRYSTPHHFDYLRPRHTSLDSWFDNTKRTESTWILKWMT